LNRCKLLNTAVTTGKLSDDDLEGLIYVRAGRNQVLLKNFALESLASFTEVGILMTNFGVLIDFITSDTRYFEDAHIYFHTSSVARARAPYIQQGKEFKVTGKKIRRFNLFDKNVHGTVMRSELFGCKIMTCFF
jgi:hypothetical protein